MLFKSDNALLKSAHFFFVSHHLDYIASGNDAELGVQSFDHLYVGIVYTVKDNGINVF